MIALLAGIEKCDEANWFGVIIYINILESKLPYLERIKVTHIPKLVLLKILKMSILFVRFGFACRF